MSGMTERPSPSLWFASDFTQARERFLAACSAAAATLDAHEHPSARGPRGEPLAVDVACFGDPGARRVLFVVSGVHGIEGFAGSACQLAALAAGVHTRPGPGALVLVHALNPWGFAHRRRVTEDDVDLNRNFVVHEAVNSDDSLYEAFHDALLPADWGTLVRSRSDVLFERFVRSHGLRAVQDAIARGQYSRPDGLFYGGSAPSWSNRVWRRVLRRYAGGAERVAVIDIHTGLGAFGTAEIILRARRDVASQRRARNWYGEVGLDELGASSATAITGNLPCAVVEELGSAEVTAVTLELGTQAPGEVLDALRADHLCAREQTRGVGDAQRAASRALMTAAFCPEDDAWRGAVVSRGVDVILSACRGLARSHAVGTGVSGVS